MIRRQKIETKQATINVTASGFGVDKNETKTISVVKFESEPAYVRANAGVTKSTGNYESLRVDISVSLPCYPEEVDEVLERVCDYVAVKLQSELDKYLGDNSGDSEG